MKNQKNYQVAIIGAGPAGLFAAQALAENGIRVAIFNRDIKPGGLAEYGIFPDKLRIKNGLRAQFNQILGMDSVSYFGNVTLGRQGCFGISDLQSWGFSALLITCGAQGTKNLNLPGENFEGVYHAKDLVYHYNKLPSHSGRDFKIGKKVAIVGAGNVMTDIARYLIYYRDVQEITVVVRRGPAEVKFDKKEMIPLISYLDMEDFEAELERVSGRVAAIGQDIQAAKVNILAAMDQACPKEHQSTLRLRFLYSPKEILGRDSKHVSGLVVEDNFLNLENETVVCKGLQTYKQIDADNVIFAIGDKVTDDLDLPLQGNEIYKTDQPNFPMEGVSYEVGDPSTGKPLEGIFCAGWSRKASTGLVGMAHKDGVKAARAIQKYLTEQNRLIEGPSRSEIEGHLRATGCRVVSGELLQRLDAAERKRAEELNVDDFKFSTNGDMFEAMKTEN